ncbi:MAG: hypothetical protein ACYDCH_13700 [Gaiellaceae bacterium]
MTRKAERDIAEHPGETPEARPVVLMQRLSAALALAGEPLGRTALADLVPGKRGDKFRAIEHLVATGCISADGEGRKLRLSFVAPFPDGVGRVPDYGVGTEASAVEGTESDEEPDGGPYEPTVDELRTAVALLLERGAQREEYVARLEARLVELTTPPEPFALSARLAGIAALAGPYVPSSPSRTMIPGGSSNGYR